MESCQHAQPMRLTSPNLQNVSAKKPQGAAYASEQSGLCFGPKQNIDTSTFCTDKILLQNLILDVNEQWERSLIHSIEDNSFEGSGINDHKHDVMTLQHSESRDQSWNVDFEDDDESLSTTFSYGVLCPYQRKSIYRQRDLPMRACLLDEVESDSHSGSCNHEKITHSRLLNSFSFISSTAPLGVECREETSEGRSTQT